MAENNLNSITLDRALNLLDIIPVHLPVILLGPPGIGKTEGLKYKCNKFGARLVPKLATTLEATDFAGIPFADGKVTDWKVPNFIYDCSTDADEKFQGPAWLFIDEITSATEEVQKACLKWMHERTDGRTHMRPNVRWLFAGNRVDDRVGATSMLKTFSSRCVTFNIHADAESFTDWGRGNGIHPHIIAFIRTFPDKIMTFDPNSEDPSFACPRSYHAVSDIIKGLKAEPSGYYEVLAGTIGAGVARHLLAYIKQAEKCIPPEEICKNPGGVRIPSASELDILHATVSSLESYIRTHKKEWKAGFVYAERIMPELGIILARGIFDLMHKGMKVEEKRDILTSKEFTHAMKKWKDYISGVSV